MPEITRVVTTQTDDRGHFLREEVFDGPPTFWDPDVTLLATLLEPAETTVEGKLDCDAIDGNPSNPTQPFKIWTGSPKREIGEYEIGGREKNRMIVFGRTKPPRPNTELKVEVTIRY